MKSVESIERLYHVGEGSWQPSAEAFLHIGAIRGLKEVVQQETTDVPQVSLSLQRWPLQERGDHQSKWTSILRGGTERKGLVAVFFPFVPPLKGSRRREN